MRNFKLLALIVAVSMIPLGHVTWASEPAPRAKNVIIFLADAAGVSGLNAASLILPLRRTRT